MSLSLLRQKCFHLPKQFFQTGFLRISSIRIQPTHYYSENQSQTKTNDTNQQDLLKLKMAANEKWKSMSTKEKLRILAKDYGKTIFIFHIGISLISLGLFYILVSSGLDMTSVVNFVSSSNIEKFSAAIANSSTFLIAYTVHKLFAPVRLSITFGLAPIMVRYFRRIGLIKPAILKTVEGKK